MTAAPGGSISYADEGVFETKTATAGGLYYLVGSPQLLTADTWAYDSAKSLLYWQPPAGTDPNTADVRFKQRYATIDLSGRSNITIQGIHLLGAGLLMDSNSTGNVLDGITATYLSAAQQIHPNGPYDHADYYSFGILLDGKNNTLRNSVVAYTALSAVTIHGTGNTGTNTLIRDVDTFGAGGGGIAVGNGVVDVTNTTITHNTIYNTGYAAIATALNPDAAPGVTPTHVTGTTIANNNLFDTMLLGTDGGAIYTCCADQTTGSVIRNNWVHDQASELNRIFPAGSTVIHPYAGIYYDNGAGGVQIQNNILWNSSPQIFIYGDVGTFATGNVTVSNSTTPDSTGQCNIEAGNITQAAGVAIEDNLVYFLPVGPSPAIAGITFGTNLPSSPGAAPFSTPGCSFAGCAAGSAPPPFPAGAPAQGATPNCKQTPPR